MVEEKVRRFIWFPRKSAPNERDREKTRRLPTRPGVEALAAVVRIVRIESTRGSLIHCFALSAPQGKLPHCKAVLTLSTRLWSAPDRNWAPPSGDNTSCALKFVAVSPSPPWTVID